MKNFTDFGAKYPPQMSQAHATETNPPAVTCKPAEFIRGRAGISTAGNILKTTDFEDDPMGVGKSVLVRTLNRNSLGRPGNGLAALAANYIFLFFR